MIRKLTPVQTRETLEQALEIVGDRCTVTLHRGAHRDDAALRFSGGSIDELEQLAREVALELGLTDNLRSNGGFIAVWLR